VGRLPHGGVVHPQVAADRPHDHFAGVQADAYLERNPFSAAHLVGVLFDGFLHAKRGVARADGMVLVGEGRAEQCHDPITHHLVDCALIAMHGLHHPFEHGIEDAAGLFGIAVREQLHAAFEVGEQHGDLLALAL
jgi:hypothetical protein